jgi:hypothetical protein
MKLFLTAGLLVATAAFAAAAKCVGPSTDDGTDYECDGKAKTWFQGEDDISADWATTHEWQSARPGIVTAANVVTQCSGKKTTCFKVIDNGVGWNPEAGESDCKCGHERFSTARVVSKKKYGAGFYELKARMASRNEASPFHVAFWLQGDKSEIDVVEFVNNNVAKGGMEYFTNHHCFEKSDEDASNTKSSEEAIKAVESWPDTKSTASQSWHTYGVGWAGNKLTFYLDGKKIRSAKVDCLVGEQMTVVLGHETNEDFGGVNDAANWDKAAYKNKVKPAVLEVSYLKYWATKKTVIATTQAASTTQAAVTMPKNCHHLKLQKAGSGKRQAYEGKNYGDPEKGLQKEACAAKCAALPMCTYWISHEKKGCILKYWGLSRKAVKNDAFEMHGHCAPELGTGCVRLADTTTDSDGKGIPGDGYRGKRLKTGFSTKDAAVSRSPGGCSQMCKEFADCNYWIVHNTKGCFMYGKTRGALKPGWKKKGYMAHGTCKGYTPGN